MALTIRDMQRADWIGIESRVRLLPEWQKRFPYIGDAVGRVVGQTSKGSAFKIEFPGHPRAIYFVRTFLEKVA